MQADGAIIYVAGNPELYPMEYYDPESGTYQGAIPDFLRAFARDCGYELRYLQPGPADRRAELAERQQVISSPAARTAAAMPIPTGSR